MVYIDNFYETGAGNYGRMKMSHMVADTKEELLEMADKIGVQRKWIQDENTYREHFDVCMAMRKKAIAFGAKPVSWMEMGRIINKKNNHGD